MARQRSLGAGMAGFAERFEAVATNVERVIQGKDEVVRLALVCLVAEGHLLIEDVPGVGKTSLAKAMAASFDCQWHRIQFTPDLLPSDVTGVNVYNRANGQFEFRPGGIFSEIVLADEINRASPRTQSALLEAMEERQVTVDTTTYRLPSPFMVIATQNPVEHQGTYPLPDSQLDRFLMRIDVGYPDRRAEVSILETHGGADPVDELEPVVSTKEVETMIATARDLHVAPSIRAYVVDLAAATRQHPSVTLGMSPRASLALQRAARARAASLGRDFVTPDDVKELAAPVLQHRLGLSAEAEMSGVVVGEVLGEVLGSVPVPAGRLAAG
ncbi:MAG TPA: MoxR family ATPase [Acidimicrobiales bacterium]|nr:MoxR family ATPase [Acidimicrobiales bacterium]